MRKSLSQIAAGICLCVAPLLSQTTSTEVLGTVSDTSDAIVPGAKITLLRVQTGKRRTAVTDSSGKFSFPLIEIGDYTVTRRDGGIQVPNQDGRPRRWTMLRSAPPSIKLASLSCPRSTVSSPACSFLLRACSSARAWVWARYRPPDPSYTAQRRLALNGQRDANHRVTLDGVIASEPLVNTVYW